jgi:hypothetical protein
MRVRRQLLRFLLRRLTQRLFFPTILTGVHLLPGEVRSYKTLYWCYGLPHNGQVLHLHVAEGLLILFVREGTPAWEVGSLPRDNLGKELEMPYTGYQTTKQMSVRSHPGRQVVKLPLWLGVALLLICASASWTTRFTLRTLLIALTLVGVLFGLAVYVTRK